MKPTLVKIDEGLWVNPACVLMIGANDAENIVQVTMVNGQNIRVEDPRRHGAAAGAVADQIAAIVNGSGN